MSVLKDKYVLKFIAVVLRDYLKIFNSHGIDIKNKEVILTCSWLLPEEESTQFQPDAVAFDSKIPESTRVALEIYEEIGYNVRRNQDHEQRLEKLREIQKLCNELLPLLKEWYDTLKMSWKRLSA